ncbi:HbrB-like protein [Metarhizium robertsii]|uniref:HbrB-like protein n=2 Tax=Metarhizium robertsii TaxID=568076 RepID=E9EZ93_METRA|nr:HbrB-like protein [Metarhizium robertsii ARSEF 23]EFY99284.1 HbrB-like protein [Metarhizium robertsii ARSEF 23]EXV04691.1 HbrB-like protein [Metarhizium robertsii]
MQPGQPPPPPPPPTSGRPQTRAPGSFSPLPGATSPPVDPIRQQPSAPTRPPPLRIDSSGSDDSLEAPSMPIAASRQRPDSPATPIYAQFATAHANASSSNVHQNFSRPGGGPSRPAAVGLSSPVLKGHSRKHSATQGYFDSTLPSTATSNLSHVSMSAAAGQAAAAAAAAATSTGSLSASQIAAQAAVMSHQNTSHVRQRSQTVPFPGEGADGVRRGSGSKVPLSPPILSLTEASAPRDSAFVAHGGQHYDKAAGSHSSAATAAANVVFPRSGHNSPREKSISPQPFPPFPPVPPLPATIPEKSKAEKSKHKLFSRPGKSSSSKGEAKDKNLQSPGKIGSALSALQRGNFSTSSLVDPPTQSLYSLNNSSSATIRPIEVFSEEKVKEKEKKHHHFLSRQKQKLKDEYHLPLSSASSNSKPTDPNAPSSLYNFNVPASPGPGTSTFSKGKKDKKLGEKSDGRLDSESTFNLAGDWSTSSGLPPLSQQSTLYDVAEPGKAVSQNNLALDEAWPYLKSKLLVVFEGEDLRLPVEDFNRVVQTHIQWCIHKRSPSSMVDDLRDLLTTGFSILDRTLRLTPEDQFIPTVVELWMFTFTSILPYMQSVFLPLDLEVSGCGVIMTPEQARDFWGGVVASPSSSNKPAGDAPAAAVLDVRRLVLTAYRDIVVLPRYDTLKTIFSRLSLEFLPSSFAHMALASPPLERMLSTSPAESQSFIIRPGTATSVDPLVGSFNSTSTTLLGEGSERGRSRAVSNVSFGSHGSDSAGAIRPFTPSGLPALSSVREQNVEDSKQLTDMVGRMLQCMSVLSSIGGDDADDEGSKKIEELCKMLKLNWLGRGRTGRNRRGIVGGRVRRDEGREELRVA